MDSEMPKDKGGQLEFLIEQRLKDTKVLLVDDNESIRRVCHEIIEKRDKISKIDSAENGVEALALMAKHNYEAAIIDLKLPDTNGLELLDELKKTNEGLLAVIVSGKGDDQTVRDAIKKHGALDYFKKPADYNEVLGPIEHSIEERVYEEFGKLYGITGLKKKKDNEKHFITNGLGGRNKEEDISDREVINRLFMKKILVISEDKEKREKIRDKLKERYNVVVASNRDEAHNPDGYDEGDLCSDVAAVLVDPGTAKEEYSGIGALFHVRKHHPEVKRIMIKGNRKITGAEGVASLKQEGAIDMYVDSLEKEELSEAIESALKIENKPLGFNNHLYLLMGPTCVGKSSLFKRLKALLGNEARVCKKYTDRPIRPEETREEGDVLPFPTYTSWFVRKKDKRKILYSYNFEGFEYGIPKTIKDDLEQGKDVLLISTDPKQMKPILESLEDVKEKIVPVMVYADPSKIKERLEMRLKKEENMSNEQAAEETLKRSKLIEEQAAAYRRLAAEFEYIITNNMHLKDTPSDLIVEYRNLTEGRFIPMRNFRSRTEAKSTDYVGHLINNLFAGKYDTVEALEEAVNSEKGVDLSFDEQRMQDAGLSEKVLEDLPTKVLKVKKAHGRVTLVFENYQRGENRELLRELLEMQTGEKARYTNTDPNYKINSHFGLLKGVDRNTRDPLKQDESKVVNDLCVFSLTDYAGKILPDNAPYTALNIAFLKSPDTVGLDSLSNEDYQANKDSLAREDMNAGINDFKKEN